MNSNDELLHRTSSGLSITNHSIGTSSRLDSQSSALDLALGMLLSMSRSQDFVVHTTKMVRRGSGYSVLLMEVLADFLKVEETVLGLLNLRLGHAKNGLKGEIPEELVNCNVFGCTRLTTVLLSKNNLTGSIPVKAQVNTLQSKFIEVLTSFEGSEEKSKKELDVLGRRVKTAAALLTYLKTRARLMGVPHLAQASCGIKLLEGVGLVDKNGILYLAGLGM
ncbi:hypothetical protein Droror1_Dr00010901 [Drosera rotundifolia]